MTTHSDHEHAGVQELMTLLGVSRARIYQLLAQDPTFPKPVAELRAGKIWHLADVQAWATTRRPPGRPANTPSQPTPEPPTPTSFRFPGE